MRFIYLVVATFGMIQIATAQNSLEGNITQQNSNEPLPATVFLPQLEKGTVANLEGHYVIDDIPSGTYTVIFSIIGYESISERITFSENQTIQKDLSLAETAIEMEEVIISTPFHQLQRDNVMKVARVATSELKQKGAVTLAEGIAQIPGVESVSTGAGIGKPVIRGLSANRVLTYAQGVRLENQQFGDEHALGVSGAGVESVEVIKGPASLLYGSDALGGVLYLNPERFTSSNTTEADGAVSYFSNSRGSNGQLGVKTSGKRLKFIARGSVASHSDYQTGNDERVTNSRFNEKDLKLAGQYQGTKVKSTLRYNYNRANIGIPEDLGVQTTSKTLVEPFQEIDNHILSSDNTLFFKSSSLNIKVGYLFNDRREFEDHEEEGSEEEEHEEEEEGPALQLKLNTLNYNISYSLPQLGKFETIVGVQGMFQQNKNFGEEILIPDARTTDIGVMATTHLHLDQIDVQAGLRFDHRDIDSEAARVQGDTDFIPALQKDFQNITAALGGKYDFLSAMTLRLNLASGFRAPNLAELTSNGVHEGTNRYEIGNPNLKSEQNFQTDVSLEFRNEHVELFANGFYNRISDYIFISPTGEVIGEETVFEYLQDDSYLYGGEFGVHLHPHPLDWLHVESTFQTVTGKQDNGDYLPLIPANSLTNTLRFQLNENKIIKTPEVFVSLRNTFDKEKVSDFETRTGGYALLSAGVNAGLHFKQMEINLGITGTNLLNKDYIAHLSRLKQDDIGNTGRNVIFRLGIRI